MGFCSSPSLNPEMAEHPQLDFSLRTITAEQTPGTASFSSGGERFSKSWHASLGIYDKGVTLKPFCSFS